jgi:hypothetical protein
VLGSLAVPGAFPCPLTQHAGAATAQNSDGGSADGTALVCMHNDPNETKSGGVFHRPSYWAYVPHFSCIAWLGGSTPAARTHVRGTRHMEKPLMNGGKKTRV